MSIDYEGMGVYFNKSSKTLRRWETEKPEKFKILAEEFLESLEGSADNECILIAIASGKGGVGKSTIADSLAYYLGDSLVINTDIAQKAGKINASETIDYVDYIDEKSIDELIDENKSKYRYIIIDTAGEITSEVLGVVSRIKNLVIPMVIGRRSREATKITLDTFFGEGTHLRGDYKLYFLFNQYKNALKRDESSKLFKQMYDELNIDKNVNLKARLGALDHSNAIVTAEEKGKSVISLAAENRGAYGAIMLKLNTLCSQIENFFEL